MATSNPVTAGNKIVTTRPMIPQLRKPLTDSTFEEVEYAADLYQRAAEALDKELCYLHGAGVRVDWEPFYRASCDLSMCAAGLKLLSMEHRAAVNAQKGAL